MTAAFFDHAVVQAFTEPPVNDGNPNGSYAHAYLGRHKLFTGRRYRRGNNRCAYCGAVMTAHDGEPDPLRHLSPKARMVHQIISRTNPLLNVLRCHDFS